MISFETSRRNMVDNQLRPNKVTDPAVLAAMGAVPRELFVPEPLRGVAYVDEDIALGEGRFLMEPMVLGRLLQEAAIGPEDVMLVIGCGSGYTAAVCSRLAATVVAVESNPRLAAEATRLAGELGADNVVVVEGPLKDGYGQQAPYDVILIGGAVPEVPLGILQQLSEGGRLVSVIGDDDCRDFAILARNCEGAISRRVLFDAAVPALPGFEREPAFVF